MAEPSIVLEQERSLERQPLRSRSRKRIALRVLADAMAVSTSLFVASIVRFEILPGTPAAKVDYTALTGLATPVWVILFWMYGLYEPRQVLSPFNEFKQTFHGVVAGIALIFLTDSILDLEIARGWAIIALLAGLLIVGAERLVVRKTLHFMRRRGSDTRTTIVLGANREAQTMVRALERETWLGYDIVGFVDDGVPAGQEVTRGRVVLGSTAELGSIVEGHGATIVLLASTAFDAQKLSRLFWELQDLDVDLQITSGTIDLVASRMIIQSVAGVPLLYVRRTGMSGLQRTLKRSMDVIGSTVGLLLLSPLILAIALWIRLDSPGGVFFSQTRVGRGGKTFRLWKFRTMVPGAEERRPELEHLSEGPGLLFKLKEDPRITRAGTILRRWSLDELPQLLNVVKGEMSLVGPRPALPAEVEQYDDWVANRLKINPGITGLWQVSGRTETSFSDYIRYDLFYIQNWSLSLDLWILWRTLRAVVEGEGAH
jgi:exopolysaccharide biosynthesis polyprenyl glycosylphosphotransferase